MQATDIQEEEIRMSINLPYVEGTSEKLQHKLRSHKIRSTFYIEKTLRKDRVATEDKNNISYEISCSKCEAVYFGESKGDLKSPSHKRKRIVTNCDCDAVHCCETDHNLNWDQRDKDQRDVLFEES